MKITESRLRRIIRSVIRESMEDAYDDYARTVFPLPPSQQGGSSEDISKVLKWLKGPLGKTWWSSASKGKEHRGCEIKITSQDLSKNPKFKNQMCMISGKPLTSGKVVVIQSKPYNTDGYADWAECKKFAMDNIG